MWTLVRQYAIFRTTEDMTTSRGVGDVPVENTKARVLIAEEEPIARLAARVLSRVDCEPETANSGSAALTALDQRGADVILCAVHFNGNDGIDLLRQLRVRRVDPAP